MLSSSSIAAAASLALHVGVVGFALAHAPARESRAEPVVDMELLAVSAGTVEPLPSAPRSAARVQLPMSQRSSRPTPALQRSSPTPATTSVVTAHASPPPAAAPAVPAALPRFDLGSTGVHSEAPTRFVMPVGSTLVNTAFRAAAGSDGEETLAAHEVSVPAHLIASAPVVYPPEARAAELEASVAVEIVIDTHGRVVAARALAAPGYGLEQAALRAVREYRFAPAERQGHPVRVRMRWDVLFRLR
jgi:periplasmic protein TonB